ncbi:unnamed protein product [Meloidogyne enterolobii]|uniref:Uncharacterized protein n=2 Tax=Meloidogyne enterolobii TaxID=390850 RepID=A0ACB0YXT1_MELEN
MSGYSKSRSDYNLNHLNLTNFSVQNGKVIGVVHAVSVGVSKHPVSDEEFAPGATKELRTCAFIAKACAERICELRGIPFTQDDRERYFYEFDPLESDRKGQSGGVAITIATLSKILKRHPVKGLCTTGQITNYGLMIKVGGLAQKIKAAKAMNMDKILLPKTMEEDYKKLKEKYKKGIKPIFAENIDDVFDVIFPPDAPPVAP